jgi:hypothetical protein
MKNFLLTLALAVSSIASTQVHLTITDTEHGPYIVWEIFHVSESDTTLVGDDFCYTTKITAEKTGEYIFRLREKGVEYNPELKTFVYSGAHIKEYKVVIHEEDLNKYSIRIGPDLLSRKEKRLLRKKGL